MLGGVAGGFHGEAEAQKTAGLSPPLPSLGQPTILGCSLPGPQTVLPHALTVQRFPCVEVWASTGLPTGRSSAQLSAAR